MILHGDYGEASRMIPSSKYSIYYYYDVRRTRPPPIRPFMRGMGACYVQRTPPAPDRPPLWEGRAIGTYCLQDATYE